MSTETGRPGVEGLENASLPVLILVCRAGWLTKDGGFGMNVLVFVLVGGLGVMAHDPGMAIVMVVSPCSAIGGAC